MVSHSPADAFNSSFSLMGFPRNSSGGGPLSSRSINIDAELGSARNVGGTSLVDADSTRLDSSDCVLTSGAAGLVVDLLAAGASGATAGARPSGTVRATTVACDETSAIGCSDSATMVVTVVDERFGKTRSAGISTAIVSAGSTNLDGS